MKAGVDAIGFILHADSPRKIDISQAVQLRKSVPAFVNVVGVFVDADVEFVRKAASEIGLDTIQLHGQESPDYVKLLNLKYIKALRTKSSEQVMKACEPRSAASFLDTASQAAIFFSARHLRPPEQGDAAEGSGAG